MWPSGPQRKPPSFRSDSDAPERKAPDSAEDRIGYPQARWRLATRAELDDPSCGSVVETQLGFHVVKRRQPPPEAAVSGKRLVIRYKDTIGPGPSQRSRK